MLDSGAYNRVNSSVVHNIEDKMIFLANKVLFIHNPKCAGSSIKTLLRKKYKDDKPLLTEWHYNYNQILEKNPFTAKNFFKFAFIRNPFDRFVSAYYYNMSKVSDRADYHWNSYPKSYPILEEYINKDINDFIGSENFEKVLWPTFPVHFNKQIFFINDKRNFDVIGKYERLEEDLMKVGLKGVAKENQSSHGKYQDILSDDSMKKIEEMYDKDFKLYEEVK